MATREKVLMRDFTQGSVFGSLVAFALPLFLSNLLQMAYNMADVVIVGNVIGKTGLSAVAIGGDIMNFLTFVAVGFTEAAQVIISQRLGANKLDSAKRVFGNACSFLFLIAITMTFLASFFCDQLLMVMSTPEESWEEARKYTFTCAFGLVFVYGYNALGGILRGIGDSKGPLFFVGIATLVNIFLDILFVAHLGMRSQGAALATVISQATSFFLGAGYLVLRRKRLPFKIEYKDFLFHKESLSDIVGLGIPMTIRHTAVHASKLFVSSWINSYGVVVSAVAGIGGKINAISALAANCLHSAGATMVGQNIGAKKYERVPKVMLFTFLISASFSLLFSSVMFLAPEKIFSLLTSDFDSIRTVAMEYVPITYLMFLGVAVRAPMNTIINGGGNQKINFVVALLDGIVLRLGLSVLFGLVLDGGYMGFWYGDVLAGLTPFFIGGVYYLSGKWKKETKEHAIQTG